MKITAKISPSTAHALRPARAAAALLLLFAWAGNASCQKKADDVVNPKVSDDLAGYRMVEGHTVPSPQIVNPNFAEGIKGWNLPQGFRDAPREGINQTGALYYERTDAEDYVFATQPVKLIPGAAYRVRAKVKAEEVKGGLGLLGASVFVQWYDEAGIYVGGYGPKGALGTTGWTDAVGEFTVSPLADHAEVGFYITKGNTGKAWFTDVTIEPVTHPPGVLLLNPIQQRFFTNDGKFAVKWDLSSATQEYAAKDLETRVEVVSGDKIVKVGRYPCNGLITRSDLGSLPEGDLTLRVALLDPAAKAILHKAEFPVTCIDPAEIPARGVQVDAEGRTFVSGKPFLPVGLYMLGVQREDISRISDSPFNCIMPYESTGLKFRETTKQGIEATREVLDASNTAGIKVIFSIKDLFEHGTHAGGQMNPLTPWNGVTGEKEIVTAVVEAFRESPALLAWYIADEKEPEMAQRLIERTRLVRRLDPWRPTWAVYCKDGDFSKMAATADVLGTDPYPIHNLKSNEMGYSAAFAKTASDVLGQDGGGLPLWNVPQAHMTALYNIEMGRLTDQAEDREDLMAKYRAPSEEEMRSMSLLAAIAGARGFIFYSYFDLLRPAVLPDFEHRWNELCNVGLLLRELQPFLYSDETAPAISIRTIQGDVRAAAYKVADGRVKMLISGTGPGASEAEITIAGIDRLTSRYGKTEARGSGTYHFKGTDICSDVLEQTPVNFAPASESWGKPMRK
jgi:hypothetical protein